MDMKIEAVGKVFYTVHLTEEDVGKIKKYLSTHNLPQFNLKEKILFAVDQLRRSGEIKLYIPGKYVESDFWTESINWSEFEEHTADEILGEKI